MSAATDQCARALHRQFPWLALAAPALILTTLVAQYLVSRGYDLLLPESIILMATAGLAGLALGALSWLRPGLLESPLIAVLLVLFIYRRPELFDPLAAATREVLPTSLGLGTVGGVLLGLAVGIVLLCWILRQTLSAIVSVAFGAMLVATLLLPEGAGGRTLRSGALSTTVSDLAPVVHIILDEHIGLAGLPPEIQKSSEAADVLRSTYRDFVLHSHAFSRYAQTDYSLVSLTNGEPGPRLQDMFTEPANGPQVRLERNEWFRQLRARGYAISVYQSSYLDFCSAADACYTYTGSLHGLRYTTLTTVQRIKVILGPLAVPGSWPNLYPLGAMEALHRAKTDIEQRPRGTAYILHLILPHVGYLYQDDCSISDLFESTELRDRKSDTGMTPDDRRASYDLYLSQLICVSKAVSELFDGLKRAGVYDEATIIVHGDHGSRIGERPIHGVAADSLSDRDIMDHFSTLLAVKTPTTKAGVDTAPVAIQDHFARQFLGIDAPDDLADTVFVLEHGTTFESRKIQWPPLERHKQGVARR